MVPQNRRPNIPFGPPMLPWADTASVPVGKGALGFFWGRGQKHLTAASRLIRRAFSEPRGTPEVKDTRENQRMEAGEVGDMVNDDKRTFWEMASPAGRPYGFALFVWESQTFRLCLFNPLALCAHDNGASSKGYRDFRDPFGIGECCTYLHLCG
ncbi:hypothetical protein LY76DRAFT_75659 [Colletotrichum caudatum]|nr:hypothetical protein LY76DRAFT_75659 [Colletotrichum caudatum]